MEMEVMIKVLFVDDDPSFLELSVEYLRKMDGIDIISSKTALDAMDILNREDIDVVVCDYQMPVMDGIDLLREIRRGGKDVPFILLTGKVREEVAIEALNNGANFYLQKGLDSRSLFMELANNIRQLAGKRRAEQDLVASEERLLQIIQGTLIPTFVLDKDHNVTHWNGAMERLTGVSAEVMIGTSGQWKAFYDEKRPIMADLVLEDASDEEIGRFYEGRFHRSESLDGGLEAEGYFPSMGEGTWLYITATPLLDGEGNRVGAIETTQDITEVKRGERGLLESEARYREIFENTGSAMMMVGEDGVFRLVNSEFERMTGYSREEVEGKNVEIILHHDERERILGNLQSRRMDPDTAPEQYEFRIRRKDGDYRNGLISVSLMPNRGDTIAFILDVTEKKNMEERLERSMEERSVLLDNIDTQVWIATDPETYGFCNRARSNFMGRSKEELEGSKLKDVLRSENASTCIESNRIAFSGKEINRAEWLMTPKGEVRCTLVTKTPMRNDRGEVECVVCTAKDITEFERAKESLEQLNDVLNLVNSIMRHDLLNELSIIGAALELYIDDGDDVFMEKALQAVRRSSELINRMKEFESLLARGKMMEPRSIRSTICSVLQRHVVDHEVSGDCMVMADEALESAFDNIVRNAIIHGKADRIEVTISCENGICRTRISDDGTGVPEDVVGRIFDRGFKHGPSGGTGLGLYLVRRMVERYNGKISIERNHPQGTVFELRFPAWKG